MILSRAEENKNRLISAGVTLALFTLLLLFLILFQMVTPNPPFPEGGGGGQELALGMMTEGNGDVDFGSMGEVTDVVADKADKQEKIVTDENGEEVPVNNDKPEVKDNQTVIKPVKPKKLEKVKTEAEKLAEKLKKNKNKTGGGHGNSADEGENGAPEGDPFGKGSGGTGGGNSTGNGPDDGPGDGPGSGPGRGGRIGIDLKGRAVVVPPKLPSDTKEEGKVVVDIVVDKEGNVIEASPNGRGTTTSSAALKEKARQAAKATKFTVNGKFEEQRGTITIIFSFD